MDCRIQLRARDTLISTHAPAFYHHPDLGCVTCNIGYSPRSRIAEPPTPIFARMDHGSPRNICDIPPHGSVL
ncbi:hypothetical protein AG1IA_03508 [Rhizoctonia solani AG-1 IA]|uniref:Uncharacterized protein n=1 Tax=Thanatephorus cucumeris (strain AG1-IA) TaxID=983506 RepID=L8X0D1_THACA|nr:hypothetical protein AG1IA_03508 [Rhizoctonia solani AG-1 IA]